MYIFEPSHARKCRLGMIKMKVHDNFSFFFSLHLLNTRQCVCRLIGRRVKRYILYVCMRDEGVGITVYMSIME